MQRRLLVAALLIIYVSKSLGLGAAQCAQTGARYLRHSTTPSFTPVPLQVTSVAALDDDTEHQEYEDEAPPTALLEDR